ncbi:MAG: hypothetical protein UT24_C0006G0006 [Candidatus Woesebacteria bacterium GW2011_GWB1_39_12]|uniref:PEGA domain-containing protein n=2 Tax=Candidatus Woeseibacteriota TaxID=1752722 RepID=A0A0G0MBA2_9BACT|nr:MAG: hypothetical protein UT23_C0010G0006 [Candidatus Woesebacteria bacterium GW2011_GWA1_39_12]KKR01158.1 MAG: hypothetical protein UT24_C0006G0006 [Candidatus Woesebacteria bacterium GW2011_GWB1_39_12]
MTKIRLLVLLTTFLFVGSIGTLVFQYAKGFRFNQQTGEVTQNGILVIKSYPDGAEVFINGELKTGTNATIPLPPSTYDISIRKEGFFSWEKRINIKNEEVTEATAHLFKLAPSLSPLTFSGVQNVFASPDISKISYTVPLSSNNNDSEGLWIIETINLPIGFSRDPRRITDGNLDNSTWVWSPDAREILLTTSKGDYLLDTTAFTPQSQRVNIKAQKASILKKWDEEKNKKLQAQIRKLPDEVEDVLTRKASAVVLSPDENMVLYTASSSATIPENLIKALPGSSTQDQERDIKPGRTYVYDIKEDRNFLISEEGAILTGWVDYKELIEIGNWKLEIGNSRRSLAWYPSSRHIIETVEEKVVIMDYDGTNSQTVYSGSYIAPHAYPTVSLERLLILTNLGANSTPANLYSLNIK